MITKKRATVAVLAAIVAAIVVFFASSAGASNKVTICHAAGLDGTLKYVELTIDSHAVYKEQGGHFYENGTPRAGHEDDYFGPCGSEETTTTSTPSTTDTTDDTDPDPTTTTTVKVDDTTTTTLRPNKWRDDQKQHNSPWLPEQPVEISHQEVAPAAMPVESQKLPYTG